MRTLVVGDIHSGLQALKQVLERVEINSDDRFVFLGDYVDGWSEAAETISFLIEFSKTYECVFIRGNHDELTYDYLVGTNDNEMWLAHGGRATRESYAKLPPAALESHLDFYRSLQNYFIDEENRLYVHAGFSNMHGPQYEYYPNLVYWDRTLWEMVCTMDHSISEDHALYPKRLKLFKEIYIGHTPVTRIGRTEPTRFANVWNVDTGAAFKGSLSVIDADTKEVWQSDPVWTLYPDEPGRNGPR